MSRRPLEVTPDLVIRAYAVGVFPMAESRGSDRMYWLDPALRGVLPIDAGFHLPRRLRRTALSDRFTVTADRDFAGAIRGCAEPAPGRTDTWINGEIEGLFIELHRRGYAHSVETWSDGELVGGLYGVASAGRSLGRACSPAPPMPRKWRWCIWSPGCGYVAMCCATRSSDDASGALRRRRDPEAVQGAAGRGAGGAGALGGRPAGRADRGGNPQPARRRRRLGQIVPRLPVKYAKSLTKTEV